MLRKGTTILGLALLAVVALALFGARGTLKSEGIPSTASATLSLAHAKLADRYEHLVSRLLRSSIKQSPVDVLILQHVPSYRPLHLASIATHRSYAAIQGYRLRLDDHDYVTSPKWKQEKSNNKLYTLRAALRSELKQTVPPAEWIFFTDVDTFIYNPLVPLHELLPPRLDPPAYIMGNQDHNGFNAGVMLFRINQKVLAWIEDILVNYETQRADAAHGVITDQQLIQQALLDNEDVARHFYEIPKAWANSYWPGENWNGIQLQVHLVNQLKNDRSWIALLEQSARIIEDHTDESGLTNTATRDLVISGAASWWQSAKPGIKDMNFLWVY